MHTIRSESPPSALGDSRAPSAPTNANPRRWTALIFICLAQLMVVLDVTIVNIALPSAQQDLGASDASRQWVITAYTLAFGSLLLLGGRIADYTGRKRAFLVGLAGFALASALGGAATTFGMLLGARALQGAFGALLAPAALSLLAVNFTDPDERAKAFGIFGAIAAGGGAVGLLLGGLLTEYLDWRWCLYVNVAFAIVAGIGAQLLVRDSRSSGRARFDIPGVVLVTSAVLAVVYGCSEAESHGWSSTEVVGLLVLGAVLLVGFVIVESRVAQPLLPLRVVLDRTRGSAYIAVGLSMIGMFGMFLFFTYQMQIVMHYSPVLTGVAFLPMTGAILVSAGGIASRLIAKVPPRALMVPGLLIAAAGLFWASHLEAEQLVRLGDPARRTAHRLRHGMGDGPVDELRDLPSRCERGRRGLRHGEHRPADRRLDRHRPAQHDRHECDCELPRLARAEPGRQGCRPGRRLHRRVPPGRRGRRGHGRDRRRTDEHAASTKAKWHRAGRAGSSRRALTRACGPKRTPQWGRAVL